MTTEADTRITLGPYRTKIHQEELIELLDLWEFAPGIKEKIIGLVHERAAELKRVGRIVTTQPAN